MRGFSLNFRPLTKPLANVHECNASSPKTAIGPDRNRGKKGQRLHQLFAYPDWGRIQTELTLFQSRSLRKLNVRDASFKEDAEANLNKRLDKIMRPKRSSPDSRRTGVQCFGSRCAGSFLRYGCARRQLSHRFVGFEGRDEMCVEELGAMVGMPVASSARAMAPRIEPPLRATALISRVPGGACPGSQRTAGDALAAIHAGLPSGIGGTASSLRSSLSLQRADHPSMTQGESSRLAFIKHGSIGQGGRW